MDHDERTRLAIEKRFLELQQSALERKLTSDLKGADTGQVEGIRSPPDDSDQLSAPTRTKAGPNMGEPSSAAYYIKELIVAETKPIVIMTDSGRRIPTKLDTFKRFAPYVFVVFIIILFVIAAFNVRAKRAQAVESAPVGALAVTPTWSPVTVTPEPPLGVTREIESLDILPVEESPLADIFTPTVKKWEKEIKEAALKYGFDPNLLAIIVQIESCGDYMAVSRAGARGLGQVMPFHFAAGEDPFDPVTNLNRAASYYAEGLASSGGKIDIAFAGYNGGHGRIQRTAKSYWPAETQRYYDYTVGIFWDIKENKNPSPTIERWLQNHGQGLCNQAASR